MMPLSFSTLLALFFFGLTAIAGPAGDNAIQCPNGPRSVQRWLNRRPVPTTAFEIEKREFWDIYWLSTIQDVCIPSPHNSLPGLGCVCIQHRIICAPNGRNRNRYGFLEALGMCRDLCRCGTGPDFDKGLIDADQVKAQQQDSFWNAKGSYEDQSQSDVSSKASDHWSLRAWSKTKQICGWKTCRGPAGCNSLRLSDGCGDLVCRVWEQTPGTFDDLSACFIPHSGVISTISGLGGRSIDQPACACNATYISHQCCEKPDGVVWEAPEAKLGELRTEF
jgi:hypothetical protein